MTRVSLKPFARWNVSPLIGILLVASWLSSPARAIGDDVFVVPRVPVQASADSAQQAKSRAQSQGRRRAMDLLLRRLTVEEDWDYLPKLATGQPANIGSGIELDAAALERLESGFEVFNEKSSSTTYRAFITYRFKPAAVRRLLREQQIPYSEAQTRTALVIPVLQTANGRYLWEPNNPWMAAWKVRPYNNELTPMIAPLGDLEDAAALSVGRAISVDVDAMEKMAARYSVSQVIVAHAYLTQSDGMDHLRVSFINGYSENSGSVSGDDDFSTFEISSPSAEVSDQLNARAGDRLAEGKFSRESGNFPALAEDAIESVIAKFAKPWKEQTLIDHTEASVLQASAYFKSISEWSRIRTALVSTPLISSVQVQSMSREGADILIRAYGDPQKLIVAMEAQGLTMWTVNGDVWRIAGPTLARDLQRRYGENNQRGDVRPANYSDPRRRSPYQADYQRQTGAVD